MYKCERCGGTFAYFKTPGQCPLCGVWASVKCSACSYVDHARVFIDNGDRCPKCGSIVRIPGYQPPAVPAMETCKGCGRSIKSSDLTCPHCGHTQWGKIIGVGIFSLLLLWGAISYWSSDTTIATGVGIVGAAGLLFTISEAVKGLKTPKKRKQLSQRSVDAIVLPPEAEPLKKKEAALKYSIGIGTLGETYLEFIPAGQHLPHMCSNVFSTADDNQKQVEIRLSQKRPDGVQIVCYTIIGGLPPAPKASLPIVVTIMVDGEKNLRLKAAISEINYIKEYGPFPVE